MLYGAIIGAVIGLCVGLIQWLRTRKTVEEEYFTCRCPNCDKKIRYPSSQAGHYAHCPQCRNRVPLPFHSEDEEDKKKRPKDEGYRVRRRDSKPPEDESR
jgi:hypothetical protein